MKKFILVLLVMAGVTVTSIAFAAFPASIFNNDVQFKKAVWDVASSTGTSGQLLSSTGTSTLWVDHTIGYLFVDNLSAKTPDGTGFVTSTHNLNLAHPLVQLWNGNIMLNNNIEPPDGVYSYIQIVDANTLRVDFQSISTLIGTNLTTLYLTVGGSGPQGPAGPGVSTSTANYFTYYNGTNSVTGTSFAQLLEKGIVITTNTYFNYVSSTILDSVTGTFHVLNANGSDGLLIDANNGTNVAILGSGNSSNALFYGGVNVNGLLTYTSATGVSITSTNLYVSSLANINQLGINSSSPTSQLVIQGSVGTNPLDIVSSTGASVLKILSNGYAGLNVNTPQAVLDVRDLTPTTTGAIFKVANSAGSLSYMFVSSTATTIRGTGGIVFFELGTATDNGSSIFIHGDNAAIAADTTKALVVRGGAIYFQSGGAANRMLLNSSGLFGLNTTTQASLFTIQGRINEDPVSVASTTGADMFRIKKNGNVGFGTSTPVANLSVSSGATTTVYLDSTAKGTCIVIKDSDGSGYTFLTANNGAGTFSTTNCR